MRHIALTVGKVPWPWLASVVTTHVAGNIAQAMQPFAMEHDSTSFTAAAFVSTKTPPDWWD